MEEVKYDLTFVDALNELMKGATIVCDNSPNICYVVIGGDIRERFTDDPCRHRGHPAQFTCNQVIGKWGVLR